MKTRLHFILILLFACALFTAARAQGTAFTYQGRLSDAGSPATGTYNVRFALYDTAGGAGLVGTPLTNPAVVVSNGLFTVTLDFGASIFTGPPRWLEIGVKTNGAAGSHTLLTPRQSLAAAPYAVFAGTASIANTATNVSVNGVNAAAIQNGTITTNKLAPGVMHPSNFPPDSVTSRELANSISLGTTNLIGQLDVYRTTAGTPAISLFGGASQISTYGADGMEQIRLWGTGWGEMLLYNSLSNNAVGAYVSANGTGGGYVGLFDTNGSFRATLWGANQGGQLSLYNGLTSETLRLSSTADSWINGGLVLDYANQNGGSVTTNALVFGPGSGEGISSKRTPGGNQWGLDFYTAFANRMSILNNGFVGIGRQTRVSGSEYFGIFAPVSSNWVGMYIQGQNGSRPFYGYANPGGNAWTEVDGTDGSKWKLFNGGGYHLTVTTGGQVGIGTTTPTDALLDIEGDVHMNDNDIYMRAGADRNHGIGYRDNVGPYGLVDGPFIYGFNGGALGTVGPEGAALVWTYTGNVWVSNNISVVSMTVRGGADLAEPFQMSSKEIPKGSLVIIDDENPGKLKLSERAFDTRVAGIVSGANGVNPGITLHQEGLIEGGQQVALSGRVYALADATKNPIKPGDLLTSSETPGHAMKVSDSAKAQGAIVGKAMTGLKDGKGMVLVLVTLQ